MAVSGLVPSESVRPEKSISPKTKGQKPKTEDQKRSFVRGLQDLVFLESEQRRSRYAQ
jgi:hypothetical protein